MCGFAGRFHSVALPADPMWHERADARLAHRGPDGSGHYQDALCELVHRRLALVDLSPTGAQPMANEDGSVYVVFNGEIYNHRDLRANLQSRGHRFRGTSDTEVLVHLYEELGVEMAARLQGMFAFAIYDRRARRLLLVRDRFGIKPLFYAAHQEQLVFASEMKALLALTGFRPSIDRQACYDFMGLGYVPEPLTGFAEIRALPKGTAHLVTPEGQQVVKFHKVQAKPSTGRNLTDAAEAVAQTLLRTVQRQSVADVPVAALLSGGIDSSLVVAAYCRATHKPPQTFNVRFPDKNYDETDVAQSVAGQYQTRHETIDLGESTLGPDVVQRLLRHFDQPFADSSLIPMYAISRAIRDRGVICTLSGDGGDEAFGGYGRFWRANKLVQLMRLPGWAQRMLIGAGDRLAKRTRNWGRQLFKATTLALAGRHDSSVVLAGLSNYLDERQKQELVLPAAREGLEAAYRLFDGYAHPGARSLEELSLRMSENLFAVGLPSDMLRKVDMMSMLAGIEVRVPMLDEEMVTLGMGLPHRLKTDGRTGKLALRAVAHRWLPPHVANHAKHGFAIPLDVMASPAFHSMLDDLLLTSTARIRTCLNSRLVEAWLRLFKEAQQDCPVGLARPPRALPVYGGSISREGLYQRVFMLLSLELWLRDYNLSW